jgi:hypothetical protein
VRPQVSEPITEHAMVGYEVGSFDCWIIDWHFGNAVHMEMLLFADVALKPADYLYPVLFCYCGSVKFSVCSL